MTLGSNARSLQNRSVCEGHPYNGIKLSERYCSHANKAGVIPAQPPELLRGRQCSRSNARAEISLARFREVFVVGY